MRQFEVKKQVAVYRENPFYGWVRRPVIQKIQAFSPERLPFMISRCNNEKSNSCPLCCFVRSERVPRRSRVGDRLGRASL